MGASWLFKVATIVFLIFGAVLLYLTAQPCSGGMFLAHTFLLKGCVPG